MRFLKLFIAAAAVACFSVTSVFAVPQAVEPDSVEQSVQHGKWEKCKDPLKELQSKKEKIKDLLKEGKITKEEAKKINTEIDARIKAIKEFNN